MLVDEGMPGYGRVAFLSLALLVGALLYRIHTHDDATLIVKSGGWLILGPLTGWFLFNASWRKRVEIDFTNKRLFVRYGLIIPLFNREYALSRFNRLDVTTERTPVINVGGPPRRGRAQPDKITKRFYLSGADRLHIATRCYSSNDRKSESLARKLESEIKSRI